jgi:hypothetical protein
VRCLAVCLVLLSEWKCHTSRCFKISFFTFSVSSAGSPMNRVMDLFLSIDKAGAQI